MSIYRGRSFQSGNFSDGQMIVFGEIQSRGLNIHFSFDDHWILLDEKIDGVKATKPDFWWTAPYRYGAYLDGSDVHPKPRDDKINDALDRLHIRYDRFPYNVPLSNRKCLEIVDSIEAVLVEMGYEPFKG